MLSFLILEKIHDDAIAILESTGTVHQTDLAEDAIRIASTHSIDAIITRGTEQVRRELIDLVKDLKLIARVGVGLDNIDVDYASSRGIRVVNAPGSTTLAVAEHSMLLMMSLLRQLPRQMQEVKNDNWNFRRGFVSAELGGKKLGIIGMGAIGQRVADLAQVFGMEVSHWSRRKRDTYPYLELDELLANSDVIFLGIALTAETKDFIDSGKISKMKPGVFIVNTARGGVINETDIIHGLNSGTIAGYAADVLGTEPAPDGHALIHHPKAIFTPHTAAITDETFKKMSVGAIANLVGILTGTEFDSECIANRDSISS